MNGKVYASEEDASTVLLSYPNSLLELKISVNMSNTLSLAQRIDQEAIKTTPTTRLSGISLTTYPQAITAMCIC